MGCILGAYQALTELFSQAYTTGDGHWRFRRLMGTRSTISPSLQSIRLTLDREDPVMKPSISRRLLLAGATATALLTLSVFSGSANASAAPATSAAAAVSCPDSLTSHNFGLILDNTCVEYIASLENLTANQVTLVRGGTGGARSQAFTDFIRSGLRKNFSVAVLDWQNKTVKQYNFRNGQVIRYDNNTAARIRFQEVVIS